MTTYQGDSAVYKLDLKQAALLLSDNSYPIYTIFGEDAVCKEQHKRCLQTKVTDKLQLAVTNYFHYFQHSVIGVPILSTKQICVR